MKLFLSCFIAFIFAQISYGQNNLIVGSGGNVTGSGGYLVLTDANLVNNGVFNGGLTQLVMNGNTDAGISGTQPATAQVLSVNKTGNAKLTTALNFTGTGNINMQGGNIAVTNGNLVLAPGALLSGENETRRVITSGTGRLVSLSNNVLAPAAYNSGNIGAAITSAANPGNISVTRISGPAFNPSNGGLTGIQRTFLINAATNTALNATLRFYYLDSELNGKSESSLELWKSNEGIYWVRQGADSRNSTANYVEKSGINDFSYWTLSDAGNPLSVTLQGVGAICFDGRVNIAFRTTNQLSTEKFVIEKSKDSVVWTPLTTINAAGPSAGNNYSFTDNDPQQSVWYRIKVIEPNLTFYYSPAFRGGCNTAGSPFTIFPNPVKDEATLLYTAASSATAQVVIINLSGQTMYRGVWNLRAGVNTLKIPTSAYASGIYIVRIISDAFETQQLQLRK